MYSLQLSARIGTTFEIEHDGVGRIVYRIVGLLANSVFQGNLLIADEEFKNRFERDGYRQFLIHSPSNEQAITALLEDRLSGQGVDVRRSRDILEDLLAVQNTYLSTFQSLGALGLLLGTLGLAAVQLRSVLERRGELALMRAVGFRASRLAVMVMLETTILLIAGFVAGVFSAGVAVMPHWLAGGANVPIGSLIILLLLVFLVSVVGGVAPVIATLRSPILSALRGD